MEASAAAHKPPKHRSPSYPAIDLEVALQRAQQLWSVAGRHSAPVSAVLAAWNYSAKSSGGMLALAALKKFGLIEDEGRKDSRQIRLSTLGQELLYYGSDRSAPEWTERARRAALMPTAHDELWTKYDGELPDDRVIVPYLVFEKKFSEGAASELLTEFRRTLEFAGVAPQDDTLSRDADDKLENAEPVLTPPTLDQPPKLHQDPLADRKKRESRTIQVPYSPTEWAMVQAPFPLSESQWEQMIAVLNAMKPGLTEASDDPAK
jgi:hypothetical protein